MTIRAFVPHPLVRSAVYRKIQTVVLQILRRLLVRVRRMQLRYAVHPPVVRTLATRTIRTHRALMDVRVAGLALRFRFRKHQRSVATPAFHLLVLSAERKSRLVVVKP